MVLSELRQNDHLSASAILGYVDCSLAYKFGRIDKLPMEFKSDALEFGTCIHRVLENFYSARMIGEKLLLKHVHLLFETTWTDIAADRDDIRYAEGNDFKSLLMYGKDLLTAWYNKLPDDHFTILAIEEAFTFILPGIPIPVIGAMDLVEEDSAGTIIITDFKTSGRAYSKDEVDQNQQLTMYQIAAKRNGYADREILLRFDTLIKTKTPKFEQYWTVRSELDERRLIKKAAQVWDGISKGVFVANDTSWKCKGCAYKQACDEYLEGEINYDQASNQ
ncbi:PD-(D/E)XK nuclease family protein [uncultured Desulfosarcina sp.]|uniref:RecB family exonuclease n=1 Tax=uncultured Desulfosarcina sp. TaxID=218289 RepID=UPI0029C7D454|nr:PD-(D/E)XK nuclease family protein [uncultured Desulfosarcina sp.]